MDLLRELKHLIRGEVTTANATLAEYSHDASLFEVRPSAIVFPQDAADLQSLVRFANAHRDQRISLTARSAGTDMSGGPLSESVVCDMTKHFNRIKRVGENTATVEPGVFYRDFEKETLKKNLLLPSYPASREICTVGGMTANNSGGEKSLAYGKTEQYVEEIRAVLSDGNEYAFGPLTPDELSEKLLLQTFEGNVYRGMRDLIQKYRDVIEASKPRVSKNSAGYALWNVWNQHVFNLAKLFVGSQGTLGIITEITFRLIVPKKHSRLVVMFLRDLSVLPKCIERVLVHKPESFESFDDNTLKLAVRFFPEIVSFFGVRNLVFLAWSFIPEAWMVLTGGAPKLILLAECTGDTADEANTKARAIYDEARKLGIKARVTESETEAKKYWIIRRESFNLLRHHIRGRRTAPFIDDLVVRPERLGEFLPKLNAILKPYDMIYTIAGHVGDGNFHIIPLVNMRDQKSVDAIFELLPKVNDLVFQFHGSITGEHNDGIIRSPYLRKMFGDDMYALFEQTKRIFDPDDIFNPHKKVGADIDYAKHHIRTQ